MAWEGGGYRRFSYSPVFIQPLSKSAVGGGKGKGGWGMGKNWLWGLGGGKGDAVSGTESIQTVSHHCRSKMSILKTNLNPENAEHGIYAIKRRISIVIPISITSIINFGFTSVLAFQNAT